MNLELFTEWKKTGDKKLLDKIVRGEMKMVRGFVSHMTKGRASDEDYEDLVQTACVGLLKALNTFDPNKGTFGTHSWWWMRRAVQDMSEAWKEKCQYEVPVHTTDNNQLPWEETLVSPEPSALDVLIDQDVLRKLSPPRRRIVQYCILQEMPIRVAAEREGITKGHAERLLREATDQLRDQLLGEQRVTS